MAIQLPEKPHIIPVDDARQLMKHGTPVKTRAQIADQIA